MRRETRVFLGQLHRQFGTSPGTARLGVKSFPHDFGTYHEVVCSFDDTDEIGMDFAYRLENECPESWDEQAKVELNQLATEAAAPA